MTDSYIRHNEKGEATSFVGPDAVSMYQVAMLASSIRLYRKTRMIPTRGVTISRMLKMAEKFTGQKYKKTDAEYERAVEDLNAWVQTMKSALPVKE